MHLVRISRMTFRAGLSDDESIAGLGRLGLVRCYSPDDHADTPRDERDSSVTARASADSRNWAGLDVRISSTGQSVK